MRHTFARAEIDDVLFLATTLLGTGPVGEYHMEMQQWEMRDRGLELPMSRNLGRNFKATTMDRYG